MTDTPHIPAQRTTLEDAYNEAGDELDLSVLLAPYRATDQMPGTFLSRRQQMVRDAASTEPPSTGERAGRG